MSGEEHQNFKKRGNVVSPGTPTEETCPQSLRHLHPNELVHTPPLTMRSDINDDDESREVEQSPESREQGSERGFHL
ncbi:hypothetical protein EYF80_063786 [Liparis tanakae]|uniref:Uncharacterized protein n=1 Tax=Liparis tanakae TaxID=230148 RepID=A0A4Z2EB92_9TELE|nr:hypothetical protein EYF80_063786 [Liparis tanakae]